MGERLAWLIWLCKTERCLLNALGGLFLYVMSCATAQLYQNRPRSPDLSPTWTHYNSLLLRKMQNSRDLFACVNSRLLSAQSASLFGVSVGLLTAFYGLDDRCYPKNLDWIVPLKYLTSPWRIESKQCSYQESCCSPWTCMLGHVELEKDRIFFTLWH